MKEFELLYRYAYDEYQRLTEIRNNIRNRSSFFIGLGVPLILSIATIVLDKMEEITCVQGIFLVLSCVFLITSIINFLFIFSPRKQKLYLPSQIIKEVDGFPNDPDRSQYIKSFDSQGDKERAKDIWAYKYFTNMYSLLFSFYEETHVKMKIYFILMSTSLVLSFITLIISILV